MITKNYRIADKVVQIHSMDDEVHAYCANYQTKCLTMTQYCFTVLSWRWTVRGICLQQSLEQENPLTQGSEESILENVWSW
ncbi:MAG: hypothetical protein V3G42_11145 [Oscillospiraceae bacterium]